MVKTGKEYNIACRERRVLMLKNVPKSLDMKQLRQFLEEDAPITKLTSSLMKNKPDYLQVYVTFEKAADVPVVMHRIQSSKYMKGKKIFPVLVSPIGTANKRVKRE